MKMLFDPFPKNKKKKKKNREVSCHLSIIKVRQKSTYRFCIGLYVEECARKFLISRSYTISESWHLGTTLTLICFGQPRTLEPWVEPWLEFPPPIFFFFNNIIIYIDTNFSHFIL